MPKLIVNPIAGRGQSAKLLPHVLYRLAQSGVEPDVAWTEHRLHAVELARQAVAEGYDIILAMGGDGTTNEVINGLMAGYRGEPVGTLGILPAGSGNDFCIATGWPTDLDEACQRIAEGRQRLVDIGKVNGRYFGNVAGMGFDAIANVEATKIRFLRGTPLYLVAVLKTLLLHYAAPMTTIFYDGQAVTQPMLMIAVTNGPRYGGGFWIAPEAMADDGLFELFYADYVTRLGILRLIPHILKGTHVDKKPVHMTRACRIAIQCEVPLYAHVDGELYLDGGNRFEFEMLHRALRMLA